MRYILLAPVMVVGIVALVVLLFCVLACVTINILCTEAYALLTP